jgi:hypothetical protein
MITIIAPFYRYFNKKIKTLTKRNKLFNKKKLLFWKKDGLGNNLIGLDITKRKLLYFNCVNDQSACVIIDLKDVHSCTLKKQYHNINPGGLVQKQLRDYLNSILLCFSFKNSSPPMVFSFYHVQENKKEEAEYLEIKANEWKATISKLLTGKVAERA